MISQTIDIWEGFQYPGESKDGFRPTLDTYILKGEKKRPAAIILPGSGYFACSHREAEAVALRFNAAGYHAFVLWYSCHPRRHPVPLLDVSRAVSFVREHAGQWRIEENKIAVLGFSASGHLAASLALFCEETFAVTAGITPGANRPDALILCYPVITSGEFAHQGSFECLLGDQKNEPVLRSLLSLENHVHSRMPPVFLWHTFSDAAVPVENSLMFADALRKAGVPFELHIFPQGGHGLSLAIEETADGEPSLVNAQASQWTGLCLNWLKAVFETTT